MAEDIKKNRYAKAKKIGAELDSFFGSMFSGPGQIKDLWNSTANSLDDSIWDSIDSLSDLFIEANKETGSPVLKGLARRLDSAMGERIAGRNAQEKFEELKSNPSKYIPNFTPSSLVESDTSTPSPMSQSFSPTPGVLPGVKRDSSGVPVQPTTAVGSSASTGVSAKGKAVAKTKTPAPAEALELPSRKPFNFDEFKSDMKSKMSQDISLTKANLASGEAAGKLSSKAALDEEVNRRRAQTIKNLNSVGEAIGLGVSLGDMFGASRDRRRADNLRDQIQEPSFAVRGQNRGLLRELRDAEQRRMNPYGQVAPVQDQINLGYQQDLSQAQAVSGGQASTMGTLGGAAAMRRDRNLGGLATAAAGAVGAQDQRIAGLLQQQVADDSNRDYLGLFKFQTDTNRAMQEGSAVGDAMASSRLREIESRNNVLNNLLTSDAFDVNTYSNMIRNNAIKNWGSQ